MTIELVDGKAGVAHISSEDKAIIHQAKFSKSDVVFDWGDAFKCSMSSPNRRRSAPAARRFKAWTGISRRRNP